MKTQNIQKLFFSFLFNLFFLCSDMYNGRLFMKKEERLQSEFSYRTMLFEKFDSHNTPVKPDSDSNPLRLSREELGRFTWAFLHSVAAAYPKVPTDEDKTNLANLLNSIPILYPCKDCAGHFKKLLEKNPIQSNSRDELTGYICSLHNQVNERLNKPIFDCQKASGYWGGDCGCNGGDKNESEKSETNTTEVTTDEGAKNTTEINGQ